MQLTPWQNVFGNLNIVLSPSLSSNSSVKIGIAPSVKEVESKIKNQSTFHQRLTSYELETTKALVSGDNIPIKGFNDHLPEYTNPAIKQARDTAISKINSLLAKINKIKDEVEQEDTPCPYEQTKQKFLGKNYVPPDISTLKYPETFSLEKALPATIAINAHYYNVMLTHMHYMSAEALDTGYPGITSENLGNAFATPSITKTGVTFNLNKKKLADHIEFAEIIRSLPLQEIIDNPKEVAYKLIHKFIEINSDVDLTKDLPFSMEPFSIPSLEPISQPFVEPLQSPRQEPLPFSNPLLQYIAQPNYFTKPSIEIDKQLTK